MLAAFVTIVALICLLIAAVLVIAKERREALASQAYDAETIRSLKEQLNEATKNDHRDARGRYTGA
jgi:hypothetical protein